jgi:hypothetical protein
MADAFTVGTASLQHVNLIARVMDRPAARRIPPYAWAGIEQHVPPTREPYNPTGNHALPCPWQPVKSVTVGF